MILMMGPNTQQFAAMQHFWETQFKRFLVLNIQIQTVRIHTDTTCLNEGKEIITTQTTPVGWGRGSVLVFLGSLIDRHPRHRRTCSTTIFKDLLAQASS